jgi:hypothetical protein
MNTPKKSASSEAAHKDVYVSLGIIPSPPCELAFLTIRIPGPLNPKTPSFSLYSSLLNRFEHPAEGKVDLVNPQGITPKDQVHVILRNIEPVHLLKAPSHYIHLMGH